MNAYDLIKVRMQIRKTDPTRANVYGLLADAALKIAKTQNRDTNTSDIEAAAKKLKSDLSKALTEVPEDSIISAQEFINTVKAEIAIVDEFLPKELSDREIEVIVNTIVAELPTDQRKVQFIMPKLKSYPNINMGVAKKIVDTLLRS